MFRPYVISFSNMPTSLPITPTVMVGLLLDRLHVSGVLWGIAGTIFTAIWIATIIRLCIERSVDVTEDLKHHRFFKMTSSGDRKAS